MSKFEVTLKQLRQHGACIEGYNKLVCALKGVPFNEGRETYIRYKHDAPIPLAYIAESNGLNDALWCLRCDKEAWARDSRLFAVWCARQVQHLITDHRSIDALDVAERFANGQATVNELAAAKDAAWDAARFAVGAAARNAARSAAGAAAITAAITAARDAARFAVGAAARFAVGDDAWAAAMFAVGAAARNDASDAAMTAQKDMFIKMCNGEAPWQKGEVW
jgi:hypothetical protein